MRATPKTRNSGTAVMTESPKVPPASPCLTFCAIPMGQICAVVTRYFGGVKLGTGGLVRAYGQSLNESIRLLETEEVVPQSAISLSAGYDLTGDLEQLIARFSIQVEERLFEEQLVIHGRIEAQQLDDLKQALQPIQHKVTLTADE